MALFIALVILAPLTGYLYLKLFTLSGKAILAFHAGVLFLFGCCLSAKNLRSFLLFTMIFAIPLAIDYHVIHRPLSAEFSSEPFRAGISINAVDVILGLLLFGWLFKASQVKPPRRPTWGRWIGAILIVWIAYGLAAAAVTATKFEYSLFEVFYLSQGFLLFFYLVNNIETQRDFRLVFWALFAGAVAHGLFMIMQFVTGLNYALTGDFYGVIGPEGFRSVGFFGGGDAAALMMGYVVPIGIAYTFVIAEKRERLWMFLCLVVIAMGVLVTKFRVASIAMVLSIFIVLALGRFRNRVSRSQVLGSLALILMFAIILAPFVVKRFRVGLYGEARLPLIHTTIEMVKDNLVLGVGANNYLFNYEKYVPTEFRYDWRHLIHNEYLRHLAEKGIIGASLYYLLMLVITIKLWRKSRSPDPWIAVVSLGFLATMIVSIPHRFFSIYYSPTTYTLVCVVLALVASMDRIEQKGSEKE